MVGINPKKCALCSDRVPFCQLTCDQIPMIDPEKCALCSDLVPCCDSFVTNPEEKGSGGNPLCNRHGAKAGELCGQCMDPTQKPGMSLNKRIAHLGGGGKHAWDQPVAPAFSSMALQAPLRLYMPVGTTTFHVTLNPDVSFTGGWSWGEWRGF